MDDPQSLIISVFKALIAFAFAQVFAILVYRWKFHPLSKYPGPLLAKFSDLYIVFYIVQGRLQVKERLLHHQYGPVVRIGPNRLMFQSVSAYQEIYTSKNVKKARGYAATDPVPGHPNVFTSIDKDAHRLKRKALSAGFSDQFIRKFEPVILENADIFIKQLLHASDDGGNNVVGDEKWSGSRNMTARCKYFTLDVMGMFGFGRSFKIQTEETSRGIILGMRAGSIVSGIYAQCPELRRLNLHKYIKINGAWTQARFGNFCRKMIEQRLSLARDAKPDLFSFVIETKDAATGNVFKLNDLWAESRFFLIAGSDTSATVLASVFFYLSRYPSCYEKIVSEVRNAFDSDADIRLGSTLSGCQYLRAVIDEAMRMTPPVGNALWREVCEGGQTVDGDFIPPGVNVGASLYAIFRSEQTFPNAGKFIPERWLESSAEFAPYLPQAKAAFKPFSVGSRSCAGLNLAYAEISLVLAKTLWGTDFRRPSEAEDRVGQGSPEGSPDMAEFQIKEYITPVHDGPFLQFRQRRD